MSLVTISAGDIGEYRGTGTPATARLYANRQFTDTSLVVVAHGTKRRPTFYQEFTCSLVGVNIRIASGDAFSTTDSSVPTADYTLVIYDANGKELYTPFTNLRITPTPNPTTWDLIRIFSSSVPQRYVPGFLTDTLIYQLLANLGTSVLAATDSLLGKVRLSYQAATLSDPIVVGNNDPIIRGIRKTVYLEQYGHDSTGLTNAIAAIGSVTPTDLKVTSLISMTLVGGSITIPANIRLVFEGSGSVTVPNGRTLTIGSMKDPGAFQVFFGSGNVVLASGAAGSSMRLDWWATPGTGTDSSHAIAQIMLSQANGNNKVTAGIGTWKFNGWLMPSWGQIEGSGMWGGNLPKQGTIFEPFTDSGYLIKVQDVFYGCGLRNLCLNLGTTTTTYGLLLEGTAPNSAIAAFKGERISIIGTGNTAVPQVRVNATDNAWECTSIKFEDGISVTGPNTKFFTINTVNSSPLFYGWEFLCSVGATALHLEKTGYTSIKDCQFRGVVGGGDDLTPTSRAVTGTVITNNAGGNNYLDIATGGQWQEGDIGQKVVRNGVTLYITGLDYVAGLAARAYLSSDPAADATQRSSTVYRFAPNTNYAYTGIHVAGSHCAINIENSIDEGFQYFAVIEGLQIEHPINLRGNKPQARILVNNSCNINCDGNDFLSQQFIDGTGGSGQLTRIALKGDTISPTSVNLYNGTPQIVLLEAQLFGGDRSDGIFIQGTDSSFTNLFKTIRELPLQILERTTANVASLPLLSLATARSIATGLGGSVTNSQPMLEFGRAHPVYKKVDYWYHVGYQYYTGLLVFWSNVHTAYKGYKFDSKVMAPAFQVDIVTIGTIVANTNNLAINTTGGIVRLDSTGWFDITGFALPTDPAVLDFDAINPLTNYDGCKIEFVYVGTTGVFLRHQSGSSSAPNRLNCDWQDSIALGPEDRAIGIYRNSRWNISLLSRPEQVCMLTADVVKNNTAALAATTLAVNLKPGRYIIEIDIPTTNATKSPQFDLNGGTVVASTFAGNWEGGGAAAADNIGLIVSAMSTAFSNATFDGKPTTYRFRGAIIVTTPGTLAVRMAQITAHASNTTMLAGSTIKAIPAKAV